MEDLSRLRAALRHVLEQDNIHGEQDLFEELISHKQDLLRVCAVGGKNSTERREIESGAYPNISL
jgi:nuclear pore complex protein Nup205